MEKNVDIEDRERVITRLNKSIEKYDVIRGEKSERFDAVAEEQKDQILTILEEFGIKSIVTNGYWFHFSVSEYQVEIINQRYRIICEWWILPKTEEEKIIFNNKHKLSSEEQELRNALFDIHHYLIDGNLASAVNKFLRNLKRSSKGFGNMHEFEEVE